MSTKGAMFADGKPDKMRSVQPWAIHPKDRTKARRDPKRRFKKRKSKR